MSPGVTGARGRSLRRPGTGRLAMTGAAELFFSFEEPHGHEIYQETRHLERPQEPVVSVVEGSREISLSVAGRCLHATSFRSE